MEFGIGGGVRDNVENDEEFRFREWSIYTKVDFWSRMVKLWDGVSEVMR